MPSRRWATHRTPPHDDTSVAPADALPSLGYTRQPTCHGTPRPTIAQPLIARQDDVPADALPSSDMGTSADMPRDASPGRLITSRPRRQLARRIARLALPRFLTATPWTARTTAIATSRLGISSNPPPMPRRRLATRSPDRQVTRRPTTATVAESWEGRGATSGSTSRRSPAAMETSRPGAPGASD